MRGLIAAIVATAVLSTAAGFALGRASYPAGASAAGASVTAHLKRIEATLGKRPDCGPPNPVCDPPTVQGSLGQIRSTLSAHGRTLQDVQRTLGTVPDCSGSSCFPEPLQLTIDRIDRQTRP